VANVLGATLYSINSRSTFDALVSGFQVWDEVSLTRMLIDKTSNADETGSSTRACAVEQPQNAFDTTDVEIATDAAPARHSPESRWRHQDHVTRKLVARRVKPLVQAEVHHCTNHI